MTVNEAIRDMRNHLLDSQRDSWAVVERYIADMQRDSAMLEQRCQAMRREQLASHQALVDDLRARVEAQLEALAKLRKAAGGAG